MAKKKLDPTRIRQVQELLLQGQLVTDILRNILSKWSLTEDQGLDFIAAAFEDFTIKSKKGYKENKAFHVQLRLTLYRKAMEDKKYEVALRTLQDLAEFEDLT